MNPEVSILLRNRLADTFVEFTVSFYYLRLFRIALSKFKRKQEEYSKSKLYFLRSLEFRSSLVIS